MTTYRTGRHEHRCIRVQLNTEPSDADPLIGTMDTPELGRLVVDLLNEHEAKATPTAPIRPCSDCDGCPVCHGPIERDAIDTGDDPYRPTLIPGPWQCANRCDLRTATEAP